MRTAKEKDHTMKLLPELRLPWVSRRAHEFMVAMFERQIAYWMGCAKKDAERARIAEHERGDARAERDALMLEMRNMGIARRFELNTILLRMNDVRSYIEIRPSRAIDAAVNAESGESDLSKFERAIDAAVDAESAECNGARNVTDPVTVTANATGEAG